MENNFATDQYGYLNQTHEELDKVQEKVTENVNKETNHRNIWRSLNIFSRIKKSSKAKIKEPIEEETSSHTVHTNRIQGRCKSKEMNDKSDIDKNEINGTTEDTAIEPVEPKTSFLGKLNLEGFLKIFSDLHKKKQATQSSFRTTESGTTSKPEEKCLETNTFSSHRFALDCIESSVPPRYDSSSNVTVYSDMTDVLSALDDLEIPHNSPSGIFSSNIDNSFSTFNQLDIVPRSDSTLSLLENVRVKLKDYLLTDIPDNKITDTEASMAVCETIEVSDDFPSSFDRVKETNEITDNVTQSNQRGNEINEITADPIELIAEATVTEGSNDNKLAYTIVEGDIKCMIKELLKESKDIKNTIVASGIEEDPTPLFSAIEENSFVVCEGICSDMINMISNKPRSILKAKNKAITHVSFKADLIEDIECILANLLDNVLTQSPPKSKTIFVNFCLVQDNLKNKKYMDLSATKYNTSRVYHLTKKLRKMSTCSTRKMGYSYNPKVSVRNLSAGNHIKYLSMENSLTSRIRRSAALLMALYDEMRDYSYYSCTSNILCDLYECMIKQGLISVITEKPIENTPTEANANDAKIENNSEDIEKTSNQSALIPENETTDSNLPGSSCDDKSNLDNVKIYTSKSSLTSESDDDEDERRRPKLLLPNLRYTNYSDEEINTADEIEMIEENLSKNEGKCGDIVHCREWSDHSLDLEDDININENERFLKG